MKTIFLLVLCAAQFLVFMDAHAENRQQITQHGITWTFDKPYPSGQFVTGDFWVVGPVKVVEVSPRSGSDVAQTETGNVQSRYGDVALQPDARMRNGSMIVAAPSRNQGYDSRLKNYDPALSVAFPRVLGANQTLISTSSNPKFPVPVLLEPLMWKSEKQGALALRSAAVLTVLAQEPPADAFRPPYVAGEKPLYRAADLRWELLPRLQAPAETPSWDEFERYLERPWLDHMETWLFQHTGPNENQANYGREWSRVTSIASLMILLDVPRERKQKLMLRLVQMGIDLHGLAKSGRNWSADGGHWNGRKWPILFASLMLDKSELRTPAATLFSEDQQTYFGRAWNGETALYQMVFHTFPRPSYEEKTPDEWDEGDKRSEGYRKTVSGGWPGTALAAQLMGAKAAWNHDAFFAYNDRWMEENTALDPFVNAMWRAYRTQIPVSIAAKENRKWVWNQGGAGRFVPN